MRLSTQRKQEIVRAYVLATKGQLPTNLDKLLTDTCETIPDLTEADLRKAIAWGLQQIPLRPRPQVQTPRRFGWPAG